MELAMRKDVSEELTWDISAIYPTEEALLADSKKMKNLAEEIEKTYKGKLDTPERIHDCMEQYQEVVKLDVLTATYCELAVSVVITRPTTRKSVTASRRRLPRCSAV